jgi:nitroreductase
VTASARAVIRARRSVRFGYDGLPLERALMEEIVQCGLAAPSSKNARPWILHVVQDSKVLAAVASDMESAPDKSIYVPHDPVTGQPGAAWVSTVSESATVLRQVGNAIFIENSGLFCGGRRGLIVADHENLASALVGYSLEMLGLGAVVQNMWLAAESLGLQASFMGDVIIAEGAVADGLALVGDLVGVLALGRSSAPPLPHRSSVSRPAVPVIWHH